MGIKRKSPIIILLLSLFLLSLPAEAQKVQRVVIDAGHGGHDSGAVGKNSKEKDVALSIALKTGNYIKENLKDVEVIYTRSTDVFVELYRRARIANEAKADLFISVHCNANPSSTPFGAETYVMGLHRSEANLAVARLENASILLEDDYHVKYDGFDPNSPEGYIFFSMLQNAFLDQSLSLASLVQRQFREKVNLYDRGVKQAGFLVLYKTTMPSVLIETGFISNAKEEKLLTSEAGQNKIALAIYKAVRDYKNAVEKTHDTAEDPAVTPAETQAEISEPADSASTPDATAGQASNTVNETQPQRPVFKVQFYLSKTKLKTDSPLFKGVKNISYYKHQGMYKYTTGEEPTPEEAQKLIPALKKKGFNDAFVVVFMNGERISLDEGKKLLKN